MDNLFIEITPESNRHGRQFSEEDKQISFIICKLYNIQLNPDNTFINQQSKDFILLKITTYKLLQREEQQILDEQFYQKYEKYIRKCKKDAKFPIKRKTPIVYETVERIKSNRAKMKRIT
jgi:hypothetical protein